MSEIEVVSDAFNKRIADLYQGWIEHTSQVIKFNLQQKHLSRLGFTFDQMVEMIDQRSFHQCCQIKIENRMRDLGIQPPDLREKMELDQ